MIVIEKSIIKYRLFNFILILIILHFDYNFTNTQIVKFWLFYNLRPKNRHQQIISLKHSSMHLINKMHYFTSLSIGTIYAYMTFCRSSEGIIAHLVLLSEKLSKYHLLKTLSTLTFRTLSKEKPECSKWLSFDKADGILWKT